MRARGDLAPARDAVSLRRVLLVLAALSCVLTPLLLLVGVHSPVRTAATLGLFVLAPGVAALPAMSRRPAAVELGLVVATSLAVCTVGAQLMLWFDVWSPTAATCVLAAACLLLIAARVAVTGRAG